MPGQKNAETACCEPAERICDGGYPLVVTGVVWAFIKDAAGTQGAACLADERREREILAGRPHA